MKYYLNWEGCKSHDGIEKESFFPCEVPGNIQYDYAKMMGWGDLDEIMFATNVEKFLSIEDDYWFYRTKLDFDAKNGEKAVFVAEGIDYIFDIIIDGEMVYSHEGMYTKTEIDVSDKKGKALEVRIHPHPKRPGAVASADTFRSAASQSFKPDSPYGWDWNPRLMISGIWKDAYVETRGQSYISSCEPFYDLNEDRTSASVRFETVCDGEVTYTLSDMEGNVVYEGKDASFTLDNINLWWCNGQGTPYLYTWKAKSADDEKSGRIGFRTLRLVHNGGADSEPATFPKSRYTVPITVELNGRRIFSKGSNWVNPELFFGRITGERYRELLDLAKEGNMNILRLWGGSGLKKTEFYEICDEYGIMLFQEFCLACNNYEGTPEYLRVLEQEATAVIKDLRRHPSIAFWCGGNELFNNWSGMDDHSHALRLLNKLCYELDFKRPYIMTSPLHGMKHGCYVFEAEGKTVYEMFRNGHGTAYTEFGVSGITTLERLKKIIPENELFPIERTKSWVSHHGFGAWGEERWLCLDILRKYFGESESIEELIDHSHQLQCEGYKAIYEEARRQWPYCSMAINWCFDEPWICAANNSLVAYPAVAKPAFYAVKESLRPKLASARLQKINWKNGENFTAELWYLNDSPENTSDTVTAYIELDGEKYELAEWKTGDVKAGTNKLGIAVNFTLPDAPNATEMTLHLESANGNSSEYRLIYNYKGMVKKPKMLNI
ncbi:MAG: hypothetical protein IKJ91_08700 [Clostridia bacterium]|nr:hypothetical protein [Clostridia bacterium]